MYIDEKGIFASSKMTNQIRRVGATKNQPVVDGINQLVVILSSNHHQP